MKVVQTEKRLALGTVQFGLPYGISNIRGQIPEYEIDDILIKSFELGIDTLDTSFAYGVSEEVIGKSLLRIGLPFKIISKLPSSKENPETIFNLTLNRLGVSSLHGYLLHHFSYYNETPSIWNFFESKKEDGVIKKIGFSLYYPSELEILFKNKVKFDLLQIPYSIFDRRFEKYFEILNKQGVEIHVRSVFLQGLFFKDPQKLSPHFNKVKDKIEELHHLSDSNNISISSLCLCFVANNKLIDKIIIGIDSSKNIQENTRFLNESNKYEPIKDKFDQLIVSDENILLPFNWK